MQQRPATTSMLKAGLTAALLATCGSSLLAQKGPQASQGSPRLLDSVEAPYAYVSLGSVGNAGSVGDTKANAPANAVRKLLEDPSLDAVFAGEPTAGKSGGSQALGLVRGMLSRGAIELELAMTGIVGRDGAPLLVLRARLQHDLAVNLRSKLEETTKLAVPNRKLGNTQTYKLRSERAGKPKIGETVELAMVGDDLIVGNDGSAMREVLVPQPQKTSAQPTRRVLSADPRFQSLRKRLDVPKGSLIAFGDWQRLGRRLQSSLTGAPAQLLKGSGLGSARSIMMTIAPASKDKKTAKKGGFDATLLLDFDVDDAGGARDARTIKGWFAATEPVAAKQLVRELPRGGLGGMVLSVDLMAVADHSPRSSHMVWDLRDAYTSFGLDYRRNLLGRLASRGTVQMHFGSRSTGSSTGGKSGTDDVAVVTPVYSVRAKSRTAANDIFSDLRRVVESTNFGKFKVVKDKKGRRQADMIHLSGAQGQMSAFICVHDDRMLLAQDEQTLVQVLQEWRRSPSSRRNSFVTSAVKSIGGGNVAGLFDLDLNPLFQHISDALANGPLGRVDLSALPKRHVGYLDTDSREDGAVVRIRLLSSR